MAPRSPSARRGLIDVRTNVAASDVALSIRDTGGGIRLAIRDRLFEPFFTTQESGNEQGKGSRLRVRSLSATAGH